MAIGDAACNKEGHYSASIGVSTHVTRRRTSGYGTIVISCYAAGIIRATLHGAAYRAVLDGAIVSSCHGTGITSGCYIHILQRQILYRTTIADIAYQSYIVYF